jgi:hypothetical protein
MLISIRSKRMLYRLALMSINGIFLNPAKVLYVQHPISLGCWICRVISCILLVELVIETVHHLDAWLHTVGIRLYYHMSICELVVALTDRGVECFYDGLSTVIQVRIRQI